ncbi:DUF2158 domain-containing protein [Bradyrhizobium genosp. SA-3]|uniref:DUF2158 domain-containing protein n=1 Tax=Bradyrhizobium genosp. SA-3 TaxID=508868 RepID=UPI001028F15D|nr:DUF2158 domain-containing protein [Bradyrhizobium genosp. SA-3]
MSEEIKPGSVVQLKSGGPLVTAAWVQDELGVRLAYCEWFIQDKAPWKQEGSTFPTTSLKLIEP